MRRRTLLRLFLLAVAMAPLLRAAAAEDLLPSWNDGPTKAKIVAFVARVTTAGGMVYVAPEDRIAVFDNDGTLWGEQPLYVQLAFAIDRENRQRHEPYRLPLHPP